jgi:hypothetical protein
MQTYEITLDDTPKSQLLLDFLKGIDIVKNIRHKDLADFVTEGESMSENDFREMIDFAENDIKNGNLFSSEEVRKLIRK